MKLNVIQPGCIVSVGGDIPAIVLGVTITDGPNVRYQVAWWEGRTRKEEWMAESEVKTREPELQLQIAIERAKR